MLFFIILPYIICCYTAPWLLVVGRKEHQQRRKKDVTKSNYLITLLAESGLKAMWILQHQRGYKPFKNIFGFKIKVYGKI